VAEPATETPIVGPTGASATSKASGESERLAAKLHSGACDEGRFGPPRALRLLITGVS
jgi:hypothetical protein